MSKKFKIVKKIIILKKIQKIQNNAIFFNFPWVSIFHNCKHFRNFRNFKENFQSFSLFFTVFCSSSIQFHFRPRTTWMRLVVCKTWFYLFNIKLELFEFIQFLFLQDSNVWPDRWNRTKLTKIMIRKNIQNWRNFLGKGTVHL